MGMAFLKEVSTGAMPTLPAGVKGLSVNELSVMVSGDADQIDAENLETRVWRASLPVLHLCRVRIASPTRSLMSASA